MTFFIYSALFNAFVAGLLGTVVILKNRKDIINRLFFGLTFSVIFWSLSYWQWMSADDSSSALFWSRILSIGSLFIPVFYFHWIMAFTGANKQKAVLIRLIYAVVFIFLLFSFSDYFIKGVEPKYIFSFWPVPGILYNLYLIFIYFGLTVYALIILWRHYKIDSGAKKQSIKYIIIGSIIGFGGGATNFFLWYNIPIYPYGNALVSLYPIVFAIATFKYGLFNIKVIATELLTFSIWIFIVIRLFLSETLQERLVDGSLLVFLVVSGILLIRSVLKEVKHREEVENLAKQLKTANARLKKLDTAKSEFISIASHQLRTPLTVIKGYLSMIKGGDFGLVNEKQKDPMDKVAESSERLVQLVENMLNVSRIEAGRVQFNFSEIQLEDLVKSVVDELMTKAKIKSLRLNLKLPSEPLPKLKIDEEKIRQVIMNLIENSIKYTDQGSVSVELSREGEKIKFSVSDTGAGIKKEDMNKLFQKFSRGTGVTASIDGTGLGLFVAKQMIVAHKGRIWAESEGEGKGSKFCFTLPIN
jgi:signal transduction histidine kinase